MNFSKASDGEPTLLSFDDAKTLFHEFGHALTDFEAAPKIAKPDGSDAAPIPEGAPLAERRIAHAA
jgi:Zn-dependent oligopeptidase